MEVDETLTKITLFREVLSASPRDIPLFASNLSNGVYKRDTFIRCRKVAWKFVVPHFITEIHVAQLSALASFLDFRSSLLR